MTGHRDRGTGRSTSELDPMTGSGGPMITAWVGWVWFTAILMVVIGAVDVIQGLVALFRQHIYVAGAERVLVFDLSGWGWVHLLVGGLVVMAGFALFSGALWARIFAVLLVILNALAQFTFLPVYPLWSIIAITLCVVVIWAIVVHGGEPARV
ncbi:MULTISPECIES: hypothetical protein [unclassified Crossiella]|uniref:DUF7144 family membrane protein n=1 Tax=unclassified Crossiella TaxID=2620835 RepID=UPI0020002D8E|nr:MULTISPECIES: hypothetical protein [unclassified Crossiella]MCK2243576.1 hypothetical protein [Crossiella sp. S99.2]MCK2257434.1 hypothetical protein [Crossiella sp. S99.1]